MKVIAISGHAQNGKDTFARMLSNALEDNGNRVLIAHYADLVKYVCKTFCLWDGQKDEYGRYLLQHVGTDIVRKKNQDYWVDFIIDMLKFFDDSWDYVLIPDTRFPNEIDRIKEAGFPTYHIRVRRVSDGFISPLTAEQQRHPSETALDDVTPDSVLVNCGSLADLRKDALQYAGILTEWKG